MTRHNSPILIHAGRHVPTMSSREIATVTEKRHPHVIRDIEQMLAALKFRRTRFGSTYLDRQGKRRKEYRLPKDLTLTLVSDYRVELRYRIVRRLEALEAGAAPDDPGRIAYLAANLRRADDMARVLDAPLDTAAAWAWIAARVSVLRGAEAMETLADIAGLPHRARLAIRRGLDREDLS